MRVLTFLIRYFMRRPFVAMALLISTSIACCALSFLVAANRSERLGRAISNRGGFVKWVSVAPEWFPKSAADSWIFNRVGSIDYASLGGWFPFYNRDAVEHERAISGYWEANNDISVELIRQIGRERTLNRVHLDYTGLDDSHLEILKSCDGLTQLGICGTKCTDAGMRCLERFQRLERLYLCELPITDSGAAHVARCQTLRYVNICGTLIGPAGVEALFTLPRLQTLVLDDNEQFNETLKRLRRKRPDVEIVQFSYDASTPEEQQEPGQVVLQR